MLLFVTVLSDLVSKLSHLAGGGVVAEQSQEHAFMDFYPFR